MKKHILKKPKVIIFDWDGTLADNRDAIVEAMNIVLKHYNKDEWDVIKKTHRDPNKSLKENFPNLFGENSDEAYKMYTDTYLKIYGNYLKKVDFSEQFLNKISSSDDIKLAIISNKEKSLLILEKDILYGNVDFFKVLGNGDAAENKPSATPILEVLKNTGINVNIDDVWMVGDGKPDLDCACNAGCRPIIIAKGRDTTVEYFAKKEKENENFVWCKGGFKELLDILEGVL